MHPLENVLRPYAWGSRTAISDLLGREPSGKPEAELWIGAHPDAPSTVLDTPDGVTLDRLIASDPEAMLGADAAARFGGLPFLVKILAAAEPLSLQVHPSPEQAQAGFAAEDAAGVDRAAPERNYKDTNHKPEMVVALTPFEALCGFRRPDEAARLLAAAAGLIQGAGQPVPALLPVLGTLLESPAEDEALRGAMAAIMSETDAVAELGNAIASAARNYGAEGEFSREFATAADLADRYPGDPGVVVSLLLNRASLAPGEALYLPAGVLHSYLSGLAVEVMASSDNVLRGGLTRKHMDVPELMKTIHFGSTELPYVSPAAEGPRIYRPPFPEFQLQRIELMPDGQSIPLAHNGPLIVLVVKGSLILAAGPAGRTLALGTGGSAFVPASDAGVRVLPDPAAQSSAVAFAVTINQEFS